MIGLIVGSGYERLDASPDAEEIVETPYGDPSSPMLSYRFGQVPVLGIVRHGRDHSIAPHEVNYRANLWALHAGGVTSVLALNVVGAIEGGFGPGDLAIPDQLIDYTWGRTTSFGRREGRIAHVDFTEPFDPELAGLLAEAVTDCGLRVRRGTYGVTQGPRLETAAEIDRLDRDGCGMVGMTAMPEAALARELELPYVVLAIAVNHAAGRSLSGASIHSELEGSLTIGMNRAVRVLDKAIPVIEAATM